MVKYLDETGLIYIINKFNERLNNLFTKGLSNCRSCGAPYKGEPYCEYCGRSFFVDYSDIKKDGENSVRVDS